MAIKQWVSSLILTGLTASVCAYFPADKQGKVYKGLQHLSAFQEIVKEQGINPDDKQPVWQVGEQNLTEWLLAPWEEQTVNEAIAVFNKDYGSLKATAIKVASVAKELFDASGHQLTEDEFNERQDAINQAVFIEKYQPDARAIITEDADAFFFPTNVFCTKNLAEAANTASDQKNSSTLIPWGSPVYVLGQLAAPAGLDPENDAWSIIWRPECGLKFIKSGCLAWTDDQIINEFTRIRQPTDTHFRMSGTTQIRLNRRSQKLAQGTPVLWKYDNYLLPQRTADESVKSIPNKSITLYCAELSKTELKIDKQSDWEDHLFFVPIEASYKNYLTQLHNTLKHFPPYVPLSDNENHYFAWGEGLVGPDYRGRDVSTFILKLVQPFGLWLPRCSGDQIKKGCNIRKIADMPADSVDDHFEFVVKHCQLGNFMTAGSGSNAACLGCVSMATLATLDSEAADDAKAIGGLTDNDKVPLLAFSPVGLRTIEKNEESKEDKSVWYITGKTAIYPVFKTGYLNSFVMKDRNLTFFSYFQPLQEQAAAN
ncbi:hypothetical protein CI610_00202 [invertebrate metagenome]|uniref:Uncharacterized protein n=1 Tax=invertebrate metagenome TaxID=1711999 RepID=A0A2H9TC55_9ZZZZ